MAMIRWQRFCSVVACMAVFSSSCRDGADAGVPPGPGSDVTNSSSADVSPTSSSGTRTFADGPTKLCRTDADCLVDQRCCMAGLLGLCTADPALDCPVSDLTLALPADFAPRFEYRSFHESNCLLQKCVDGPGSRRLLRFPLNVVNRGDSPMILALRDAPGVRSIACDGSIFLNGFLRYELLDANGARRASGSGDVGLTCELGYDAQSTSAFDCALLGLEPHSYRSYASDADCQWVDITTLPPGQYTLRLSVNADYQLRERDVENNSVERAVVIPPADPLAPCDNYDAFDLFRRGEDIECGWELMQGQTGLPCVPNEFVPLACSVCQGGYLPRACPGTEPCSAAGALSSDSVGWTNQTCWFDAACGYSGQCMAFGFVCPPIGMYTLLGFPRDPQDNSEVGPEYSPSGVTCQPDDDIVEGVPSFGPSPDRGDPSGDSNGPSARDAGPPAP